MTGMIPKDAVDHVNSFWEYKRDGPLDQWKFKSPGDCENYSLLVLRYIAGSKSKAIKWLLSGKARIWYCETPSGNGHAVLEYQGKFVDNRLQRWVDDLDKLKVNSSPRKPYARPFLVSKLVLGALIPPYW